MDESRNLQDTRVVDFLEVGLDFKLRQIHRHLQRHTAPLKKGSGPMNAKRLPRKENIANQQKKKEKEGDSFRKRT